MSAYLGDWVRCDRHGYIGRVTAIHHQCPESPAWIAGQDIPVTAEQRDGVWVSVLVDHGGSVVMPIDTVEPLAVHPPLLNNRWADFYFRDEVAA